jgi:hypothetical protein
MPHAPALKLLRIVGKAPDARTVLDRGRATAETATTATAKQNRAHRWESASGARPRSTSARSRFKVEDEPGHFAASDVEQTCSRSPLDLQSACLAAPAVADENQDPLTVQN